jgi:hypothetical protein
MSLIGAKCLGDFNYYLSFSIMICLPLGILVLAVLNYYGSLGMLKHRLATMTKEQKLVKQKEALHALFELADSDHSGHVEPAELQQILKSLGWSIKLKIARTLAEKVGANVDESGHLILNENQFVDAMISGRINDVLGEMNVTSKQGKTKQGKTNHDKYNTMNSDQLVKWTLRSTLISNSLSGATQLLLLAHTPVSRKVFQYFHCHNIAGREFLRADYDISCTSDEYYSFMSLVLGVLICFTIALPVVISFYLISQRNNLYTTKTSQRIGWLYDPFVRGAEFWQVHDLLMKMILTVSTTIPLCCWNEMCYVIADECGSFYLFVSFEGHVNIHSCYISCRYSSTDLHGMHRKS